MRLASKINNAAQACTYNPNTMHAAIITLLFTSPSAHAGKRQFSSMRQSSRPSLRAQPKINVTAPQVLNRIWNLKVPTFGGDYCWRNDSFPFSGTFRIRDRQLELYRLLAILFDFNALAL